MVSDRIIPPSCLKFFDDKLRHDTVILQLAQYMPVLERMHDCKIYTVFDNEFYTCMEDGFDDGSNGVIMLLGKQDVAGVL